MTLAIQHRDGQTDYCSPYEAMLRDLDQRGLSSDALWEPVAPEDLSSRNAFPYEQSREPGLYDAVLIKHDERYGESSSDSPAEAVHPTTDVSQN